MDPLDELLELRANNYQYVDLGLRDTSRNSSWFWQVNPVTDPVQYAIPDVDDYAEVSAYERLAYKSLIEGYMMYYEFYGYRLVRFLDVFKSVVVGKFGPSLRRLLKRPHSIASKVLSCITHIPYVAALISVVGLMVVVRALLTIKFNEIEFGPELPGPVILRSHPRPRHPQAVAPLVGPQAVQAVYQNPPPPFHFPSTTRTVTSLKVKLLGLPRLNTCDQLVAHLRPYAYMKERDLDLFETLRRKAIIWCQTNEWTTIQTQQYLIGSVTLAMIVTPEERAARALATASMGRSFREWLLSWVFPTV